LFVTAGLAMPTNDVQVVAAASADVTTDVIADAAVEVVVDATAESVDDLVEDVSVDDALLLVSNCTYYNNASHSQVVGQFGYDCCNDPVAWGRRTQYKSCGGCFPCIPPPR
jgi:hypothetical protein